VTVPPERLQQPRAEAGRRHPPEHRGDVVDARRSAFREARHLVVGADELLVDARRACRAAPPRLQGGKYRIGCR
jgi:hypothetical protein